MGTQNTSLEPKVESKIAPDPAASSKGSFSFIKKHPYALGLAMALVSYVGLRAAATRYSKASLGVVLEEVTTPHSADAKSEVKGEKHYSLVVRLQEELSGHVQERVCRFYIAENKEMPVDVLDDMIIPGSKVYVPNLKKTFPFTKLPFPKPGSRYLVGCHGQIESNLVRVVHPWESSGTVKRVLEERIESVRREEETRAREEAMATNGGIYF